MYKLFRAVSLAVVVVATIGLWVVTIQAEWNAGSWGGQGGQTHASPSAFLPSLIGAAVAAACIYVGTRRKWDHLAAAGVVCAVMAAALLVFTTFCMGSV